jgi:hypothetical protein
VAPLKVDAQAFKTNELAGRLAKSTFCDGHHIASTAVKLVSLASIVTARAVLTFDVPPNDLSPAHAGLSFCTNEAAQAAAPSFRPPGCEARAGEP